MLLLPGRRGYPNSPIMSVLASLDGYEIIDACAARPRRGAHGRVRTQSWRKSFRMAYGVWLVHKHRPDLIVEEIFNPVVASIMQWIRIPAAIAVVDTSNADLSRGRGRHLHLGRQRRVRVLRDFEDVLFVSCLTAEHVPISAWMIASDGARLNTFRLEDVRRFCDLRCEHALATRGLQLRPALAY